MIEFLNFVFQSGWTFSGCAFLLLIVVGGTVELARALRGKK